MTSTPSNQPVPSSEPGSWQAALASAFEVLLGRPLGDFDPSATYVLYHWDDLMSAEFLETFGGADLGSVLPPDPEMWAEAPTSWFRWSLDFGRSLFLLDDVEVTPPIEGPVSGSELAALLDRRDADFSDAWITVLARIQTDGTLFDAMRAATWTMGEPTDLAGLDPDAEVEERWHKALGQVQHPALRDHLRMLCLDAHSARCRGGFYVGADHCPGDLRPIAEQPGHTLVAAWEFGEGQGSSAVFQVTT